MDFLGIGQYTFFGFEACILSGVQFGVFDLPR